MNLSESYEGDLAVMRRLDAVCDAFEAAWRRGLKPRIEDYLASVSGENQPILLGLLQELQQELSKSIWEDVPSFPTEEDSVLFSQFIPALLNIGDQLREDTAQGLVEVTAVSPADGNLHPRSANLVQFQVISDNGDVRTLSSKGYDSLLIGRTDECNLCFEDDASVSRTHARIEINPSVCYLHDLNSSNGTFVNGTRIQEAILNRDDVITIGRTRIIVRVNEGEGEEIPRPEVTSEVRRKKPVAVTEDQIDCVHPVAFPCIKGYQVNSQAGSDAFGPNFHALRIANRERCTIQAVPLPVDSSVFEVRVFAENVTPLVKLTHSHLVQLLEVGSYEDGLYLCSESLSLRSWDEMVVGWSSSRRTRVAVSLMMQVLTGLEYAHSLGLVHGSIQPKNFVVVRIGPPFVAKLAGFGVAVASLNSGIRLPLSVDEVFPREFIAPELYSTQGIVTANFSPAADIYSAGATLYWLISGKAPVSRLDHLSSMHQTPGSADKEIDIPLDSVCSGVSRELCEIIHQALSRDPRNRFQSVKEMTQRLRAIV